MAICTYVSVLGHRRGIGLLANLNIYIYMYVCILCLGSLARYWLARKPECIYVCVCSDLGHWRGIGLLANLNVYMYVCVLTWITGAALACSQT